MKTAAKLLRASVMLLASGLLAPAATPQAKPDALVASPESTNTSFLSKHEEFLARAKAGPVNLLFLGDSITAGWAKQEQIWEQYFGRYQAANFGVGSDATQNVLWRLEHGELDHITPRVVVLLLGTNNTNWHSAAEITDGLTRVVRLIRSKSPTSKVLLLAIFPRGPRVNKSDNKFDDAVERMKTISRVNPEIAKLDDGRNVRFLDIGEKFRDADGRIPNELMPDQIHLSAAGYEIWAKSMHSLLEEMMR